MNLILNIIMFFLAVYAVVLSSDDPAFFMARIALFLVAYILVRLIIDIINMYFGTYDFERGVFFSLFINFKDGGVAKGRAIFYVFVNIVLLVTLFKFSQLSSFKYYIISGCIVSLWIFRNEFLFLKYDSPTKAISSRIPDIYKERHFKGQELLFDEVTEWLYQHDYEIEITKGWGRSTVIACSPGISTSFYVIGFILLLCGIIPGLIWYKYYSDQLELTVYLEKNWINIDCSVVGKNANRDFQRLMMAI